MLSNLFKDQAADTLAVVVVTTFAKLLGLFIVRQNHRRRFEQVGTVAELYIYPVKSCGALRPTNADCTPVGLDFDGLTDRHWMILGEDKQIVTMKEAPRLTMVTCERVDNILRLRAPDMPSLDLPREIDLKQAKILTKSFEGQDISIVDCGSAAAKWLNTYLGFPANLVYSCPELGVRDAYHRTRDWDNTAKKGDVTVFSYLTSYMITTTASLRNINSQLPTPTEMVNFRPSIVIENSIAFDEDTWMEMRIGDHTLFHSVEPCIRCTITTIDPKTGQRQDGNQPLKLLRKFRCREPYGNAPVFGLYMSNDLPGPVKVGDPVYIIRKNCRASS